MRRHEDLTDPAAPMLRYAQLDAERKAELDKLCHGPTVPRRRYKTPAAKVAIRTRGRRGYPGQRLRFEGEWVAELRAESERTGKSLSALVQFAWSIYREACRG